MREPIAAISGSESNDTRLGREKRDVLGRMVATVSPEFVCNLFRQKAESGIIVRYAFAVGMIWGVFVGAAASGFACFLAASIKIVRIRLELKKQQASTT